MNDVESRLRSALTARAGQITPERLRFGVPPTVEAGRPRGRRWWWWLLIPVAVAVVAGMVMLSRPLGPEPVKPVLPAASVPATGAPTTAEPTSTVPTTAVPTSTEPTATEPAPSLPVEPTVTELPSPAVTPSAG